MGYHLVRAFICYGVLGMDVSAHKMWNPCGHDYNDIRLGVMANPIIKDTRNVYSKPPRPTLGSGTIIARRTMHRSLKAAAFQILLAQEKDFQCSHSLTCLRKLSPSPAH